MKVTKAYLNSAANTTQLNNWGKVPLDAVEFDTGGWFDAVNDRIVPNRPGYYIAIGRARTGVGDKISAVSVYKNGSVDTVIGSQDQGINMQAMGGSAVVYCDGVDDYLELAAYELGSGSAYTNTSGHTYLTVIGPVAY